MRSVTDVISLNQIRESGEVLDNGCVPGWIAWITRLAEADRKREYLFAYLA